MKWKIPLFRSYADENDVKAVAKVIRRGEYWAIGPEIEEFEKKIARFIGAKYALVFNSGTSALHTLLIIYDVKGKEVIVPSFTFISTANSVLLAEGIPVFAETEEDTGGLDAYDVEKRITSSTKAIINIHYAGFPSRDTEKLRSIADSHKIILIDDAAESFGASIDGRKLGAGVFANSTILSFCQNKIISTGEGGALVTDSREVYERAKIIRSHGRVELEQDYFSSSADNDYIMPGYNYRMPSMLAAFGISQLQKAKKLIAMRRKNAAYMTKKLSKMSSISFFKEPKGFHSVYQMYTIKLRNEHERDALQKHLTKRGIMAKVYFNPAHLKTLYTKGYGYKAGDLPKTEYLSRRVLTIPFYPHMKRKEMDYIISSISSFFKKR